MSAKPEDYAFGRRVKRRRRWFTVYSTPNGWGRHRWRDGQWRTIPELVSPRAERRRNHAPPLPPPKPDGLPRVGRFVIVPMGS